MSLTRREFLKAGFTLMGGALTPRWARAMAASPPETPTDVAHVTGGSPEDAVRAAVDALGGIERFVRRGAHVVITPNVAFPNPPEMVTTTDPRIVAAMAVLCREAGAGRITVTDYPVGDPSLCFARTGMAELSRLPGVEVVPLTADSAYVRVDIAGGVEVSEVEVAAAVREADVLIAMPVAKCHSSAGVSLAMQGMLGLVRTRGAFHWRYDLHQAVADLSKVVRADLIVTDARRALVTRGPGGPGRIEQPRALLAGTNQTTVDAYTVGMARWYGRGFAAADVKHLRLANEQGLGEIDVAKMRVARVSLS